MSKYLRTILKKCWLLCAFFIILFAVFFTTFRALTPWVKPYKGQVEHHLSVLLGQPVTIQNLETSWYWFQPVLKMEQVTISDSNLHNLKLNELLVGINLWRSLWDWQLKPGMLYVDNLHLTVHQVGSHWEIDGLNSNQQSMTIDAASYLPLLSFLLSQDTTLIKNLSADIYFADGSMMPIQDFNVKAIHAHGRYQLFASTRLNRETPTKVSVVADLTVDPAAIQQSEGHVYVSLQQFQLAQWQSFFPKIPIHIKQGTCNLDIWIDASSGHLTNVQTLIHLQQLVWDKKKTIDAENKFNFDKFLASMGVTDEQLPRKIDLLSGNVAWHKNKTGWQLIVDQLDLDINAIHWSKNALQLTYKKAIGAYHLFIKTLMLEPLLEMNVTWPEPVKQVLKLHPQGQLTDTQMNIRQNQLDLFLTRFDHFGWEGTKSIPAIHQLAGVLYWEPTEGRLVLEGEQTKVTLADLPPLTFDLLNVDVDWKELSNGYRISMDRFVLSHPDLVLSATGALDNPRKDDADLRLSVEFSAKNANKFIRYIPSTMLKPALETWLKHSIKRIKSATGRILVNGRVDDFPYDTKPGEFSVVSHVNGVDLLINDDWPINRDMDADIVVNKRSFVANIDEANLKGVLLNKVNIVIPDIGLDHEALLLHGNVLAPGNQIKRYIFASPLRDRFARWKVIDIADDVDLDLHLEVPLYPENDQIMALGTLTFAHNPIRINFPLLPVNINDLTGSLKFNEYGLRAGDLKGSLDGFPVALHAEAIIEPKEGTVLTMEGEATIDYLQKISSAPFFALLAGKVNIMGLWTIFANERDPDQLHLETSLQGVSVNLPQPFGKVASQEVPLTVDFVFSPNNRVNVQANYDDRFNGAFQLVVANQEQGLAGHLPPDVNRQQTLVLSKGELHVGPEKVKLPSTAGLKLTGSLATLDVSAWKEAFAKMRSQGSSPLVGAMQQVDLTVGQLILMGEQYDHFQFNANQVSKNDWAIDFNQANIVANLHYHPVGNLVTGQIKHLYLNNNVLANQSKPIKWTAAPQDIPNLNLSVAALKVKDIEVGEVNLKSTTHPSDWTLDYCNIKSSDYQLTLQGNWKQTKQHQNSSLQAQLMISDLGKSLERWHITPAVDAHMGKITFQGGWTGPFYDFSLSNVAGKMQIVFKNGRISHLDKSTEEKLGLGKLLSVLSLQTIPRRLKLDFSDLSEQGYSFDIFKGNFDLKQGVMSTQDSYIDGPVAYAAMKGDFDLTKKLYDVNLRMTPYITASLPVVATIAGGPLAGLAAWVASNIINKGMQKISGYTYKISGPWLDPIVQQVSIDRTSN